MRRVLAVFVLVVVSRTVTSAQHATADDGYYPYSYIGDTLSGELTAVDDSRRQITLTYTDPKHKTTETFDGMWNKDYTIKLGGGPVRELIVSSIPLGTQLTVYYTVEKRKVNGKKLDTYTAFLIRGIPNATPRLSKFMTFRPNQTR